MLVLWSNVAMNCNKCGGSRSTIIVLNDTSMQFIRQKCCTVLFFSKPCHAIHYINSTDGWSLWLMIFNLYLGNMSGNWAVTPILYYIVELLVFRGCLIFMSVISTLNTHDYINMNICGSPSTHTSCSLGDFTRVAPYSTMRAPGCWHIFKMKKCVLSWTVFPR